MQEAPVAQRIATLLSDPARLMILWSLIDGTRRPAGELAYAAHISPQSASGHLAKLVDGGLLSAEAQGRHRYFRIATPEVADAIESFAQLSAAVHVPRDARKPLPASFVRARTCYDHLAGEVAVAVLEAMVARAWLTPAGSEFALSAAGEAALSDLGADFDTARRSRRAFARGCVDLTQRRLHLGGTLGAALLDVFIEKRWIQRSPRSRTVTVTPHGREALHEVLGVEV